MQGVVIRLYLATPVGPQPLFLWFFPISLLFGSQGVSTSPLPHSCAVPCLTSGVKLWSQPTMN